MIPILLILFMLTASTVYAAGAPVRIDDGNTMTDQADVTVTTAPTLIAASNANRASLNCTTNNALRWGAASITATRGQVVGANQSVAIRNTSAIYMVTESDTAIVSCTEESYSSSSGPVFSP